ncbi:MAG: extracellular solute-binding protein [Chloroflexi bacterium]|nr:extracellular solute-binding protein [Chloroflexota bacterium]
MTLSRRRLLGTFSLGAGAVVLAACGQSSTSAPAAPAATSAPAAPGATSAPAAAAPAAGGGGGPVTLSVISWNSGSSSEAFQNAINQINTQFKQKRPNVTVNFELLGQGATWTQAQTSRISSQTTDLTANYGFAPQDIINFQPDQQFLDLSGLPSIKNFDQINVDRFMTWKGKVWQMTLAYVGHVVWTNQDMLDKYGLKAPTTYAEWTSMADTLKSKGETPILYAAKPSTALTRYTSMLEMNVGRPAHPTFWSDLLVTGKADFTTPEWIESFRRAKEFVNNEFDPAFSGIDYPTSAGIFATGKYAMWPEGSFSGGDIMAAKPTFQKLGAFNATFSDDPNANAVQPVYGDISWSGLRYSKDSDVVLDWIDFFGQKENFQSFMQVLQYYPTQGIQLTGPVPQAEGPLLAKTAVSQVRLPLPGMTYDNQWSELLLSDQYTPESYAQYVQKNFDDSRPQWQKYIGMFDQDWAKLYFG